MVVARPLSPTPPLPTSPLATESSCLWDALLDPGLSLLNGKRRELRGFHQELAHFAAHEREGYVLWCDGDHGFDPYHFAELNMTRGYQADDGARRLLIKRCMTPFQWDSVLTQHLQQKLVEVPTSLVLVAPYDRLFSTDEMKDWEQEDHVRFSLKHLDGLAKRYGVPILLSVDMAHWWRSRPVLAQLAFEAVGARWSIDCPDGRWRAREDVSGLEVDPFLRHKVTLLDYVEEPEVVARRVVQPEPLVVPTPALIPPRRTEWGRAGKTAV